LLLAEIFNPGESAISGSAGWGVGGGKREAGSGKRPGQVKKLSQALSGRAQEETLEGAPESPHPFAAICHVWLQVECILLILPLPYTAHGPWPWPIGQSRHWQYMAHGTWHMALPAASHYQPQTKNHATCHKPQKAPLSKVKRRLGTWHWYLDATMDLFVIRILLDLEFSHSHKPGLQMPSAKCQ
jgi:hypothetical protein